MVNHQNHENNEDNLIISHPQALHPVRKSMEWSLTVLGWVIWASLCRPLLLAFLWFLGFEVFYEHMIRLGGIRALADFAYLYFTTVFSMYLLVRGWNFYNASKFRKKNKRKSVNGVSAVDLEQFFRFTPQTIEKAQEWKNIIVDFQENNQIFIKEPTKADDQTSKGYFKSG